MNIVIFGKNSYIGTKIRNHILATEPNTSITELDSKDVEWQEFDFSSTNCLILVAGIAHIKETEENKDLYYKVNYQLTKNVAQKALNQGVRHIVFLSTMSVYGKNVGKISLKTSLTPTSHYGKSKLMAEEALLEMKKDYNGVTLSIIRPPMVYGKNARGNYSSLSKFSKKTPFFIDTNNRRSMIHIDNLCEFIHQVVSKEMPGILCPQNEGYANTADIYRLIRKAENKKSFVIPASPLRPLLEKLPVVNKVFGDLYYDESVLNQNDNMIYNLYDFETSIVKTEN
ncbi:NAD-dependent epimerase/dehydratase family protein [Aerococcaceae bacterium zg-BR9]|nr:NAD-dependent epimerase/dehydratase family protein [Aerococcaceae bacterium zg-BR9]